MKTKKQVLAKAGNLLYPLPTVLVSCGTTPQNHNLITIAWAGTICSEPAMVSISIRPTRHSHKIISESKEFVINLVDSKLLRATDLCGIKSGKDLDKWSALGLQKHPSEKIAVPQVASSPLSLECKVTQIIPLGSHDMFLAEVVSVSVRKDLIDKKGSFALDKADLIAYNHGKYQAMGKTLGFYGYSVKK